ncbi:hypothetical protein P3T16_006411 [Paraburkholderia sp. GAS42]|jgi:hypothetical protein
MGLCRNNAVRYDVRNKMNDRKLDEDVESDRGWGMNKVERLCSAEDKRSTLFIPHHLLQIT